MKVLKPILNFLLCALPCSLTAETWQDRALLLARAERSVLGAEWGQDISFWVSMRDDGKNRDGFGQYLCFVLDDAGRPAGQLVAVTIWDVSTVSSSSPRKLGAAICK